MGGFSLLLDVEVRNEDEANEAIAAGADVIMLNNIAGHMSQLPLRGVCVSAGGAKKRGSLLETSGGITESKLRESAPSPVSEILRCAEDTWSFLGRDR